MRLLRPLHQRREHRRQRAAEIRGLPGVVLLLQVALAGGMSPRLALDAAAGFADQPGALGVASRALGAVTSRLALGAGFTDALMTADATGEVGPSMLRVLDLIRRSELDGEPLMMQLDIVLIELRRERANQLDTSAQRLTVALLFPLVLCILPAFIVLAVVPLVVSALAGLPT